MPVRNPRRRGNQGGNCPECPKSTKESQPAPIIDPEQFTQAQGERLWKHVLTGTAFCVSMLDGYVRQQLPGDPREAIYGLITRLKHLIEHLEVSLERSDRDRERESITATSDDELQGVATESGGTAPEDSSVGSGRGVDDDS